MKAPRFLTAPVLALFDLRIYREVRREKMGTGVLYCLYLSALFCIAITVMLFSAAPKINQFVGWLKGEWPGMTFTAEGMKQDVPGEKVIQHPEYGMLAIIDDSKTTVSVDDMRGAYIFVTGTALYTRSGDEIQSRSLVRTDTVNPVDGQVRDIHVDGALIEKIYTRSKPPIVAIFLFIVLALGFLMRLVLAFIFAAIGNVIQLILPRGLDFEQLFVLAAFALSIGLLVGILQYLPGTSRFFSMGIGLVLSFAYFILAIVVQPRTIEIE